jgi:MFS family permease
MKQPPTQQRHRQWMVRLVELTRQAGMAPAMLLAAAGLGLFALDHGAVSAALAGVVAGVLSGHLGWRYHRGGSEQYWLSMMLAFFAGWPLMMLLEKTGSTQLEQNLMTLQYFALALAGWWCLIAYQGRYGTAANIDSE